MRIVYGEGYRDQYRRRGSPIRVYWKSTGRNVADRGEGIGAGQSNNLVRINIHRGAPWLAKAMRKLRLEQYKGKPRSAFSCAEAQAVGLLIAQGVRFEDIVLTIATDETGHEIVQLCKNCEAWLEVVDKSSALAKFRIKRPGDEAAEDKTFTLVDSEFPELVKEKS